MNQCVDDIHLLTTLILHFLRHGNNLILFFNIFGERILVQCSKTFNVLSMQGPRSSGCSYTRQFSAMGACTRQFSAILVLRSTFSELFLTLSSFSKVYCENMTFMTRMSLSSAHHLLTTNFFAPVNSNSLRGPCNDPLRLTRLSVSVQLKIDRLQSGFWCEFSM